VSFVIYLTGYVILIGGLAYGASLMHIPTQWIVVGGIALVGLGIVSGVRLHAKGTLRLTKSRPESRNTRRN
jgi:hypothetical protein